MSKRKLPKVGIFDPNLSQDPQYGNVSTLPDGLKRVHFHITARPEKVDDFLRFQIILPECNIPRISSTTISSVEQISVPVIKNFQVQWVEPNNLENKTQAAMYIGLFEEDQLDIGPFVDVSGNQGTIKMDPSKTIEPIFIVNKPIAYSCLESDDHIDVSNLAARGYICLQNYVNLWLGYKNLKSTNFFSFNVYIDYEVCHTTYKEALIWRADFEKYITGSLKYRVTISPNQNNVLVVSRGTVDGKEGQDPSDKSTFPSVVNSSKVFKVPERPTEEASLSTKELVWSKAMKTYLGKNDD